MEQKILKIINKLLKDENLISSDEVVTIDSNLIRDHGIDPISIIEFVLVLEDEFEIIILDADIGKLANISECISYLINEKNVKV